MSAPQIITILKGYIGLSLMTSGEVASGLYVDGLPDITEANVDLCTTANNAEEAWNSIENRGIRRFYSMFVRELNKSHKVSDRTKIECLINEHKENLAFALQYVLGAELMHTRSSSSRVNAYTGLGKERAKELEGIFVDRAAEELQDAIAGIDIHSSACFECEEQPQAADFVTFIEPLI